MLSFAQLKQGIIVTTFVTFCFLPGQYTSVPDVPACRGLQVAREPDMLWVALLVLLILELGACNHMISHFTLEF
jgi:hypothetical protein